METQRHGLLPCWPDKASGKPHGVRGVCRLNLPLRRPWNKEEVEELVSLLLGRHFQPILSPCLA